MSESEFEKIQVRWAHDRRVLRITLGGSRGNVLTTQVMREVRAAVEGLDRERDLALIAFEGEGPDFSFGSSVQEHRKGLVEGMLAEFHRMLDALDATSTPLAALVNGRCLGGGLELALFCDFVLAEESAEFGLPEIKLGVFPPVGCALLPWRVGTARASSMILSGESIAAPEAYTFGLIDRVVPEGFLQESFEPWLEKTILPLSSSSLRVATRAARIPWVARFWECLTALERLYLDELVPTHDANEGLAAFLEKRAPIWNHGRIR